MLKAKAVAAGLLMLIFMSFQGAYAAPKSKFLKVRQPHKVFDVNKTWLYEISHDLLVATSSAENLDSQVLSLVSYSGMGWFQKWRKGIDEERIQKQFAEDLRAHLQTMTVLFEKHARRGPFDRLREFEFQNLVRRSDYILSLGIARNCLERGLVKKEFAGEFKKVLGSYNQERLRFDQKMISLAAK
ncbi:MAG: hypothetical protein ACM3MG_05270 [Bacillota bacterium]